MGRSKDQFWEHVKALNGRFKCNYCEHEFAGGAPRIKSHLSGIKGRDIETCTKVPKDVQAAAFLAISGPNKKAKTVTIQSNLEENGTISASSNSFLKTFELHEKDKSLVDKKLAQFLISNNIAANVIEAPSFKDFVRSALEFGHDYELPSYSTLQTKLIPGFAVEVEEYVKHVKKSWASTGCTLMLDMCNDMKEQAIVNVIAYSPRGAVFMNKFDISKHQKNYVYDLSDFVSSIIEEIGTDHVVQLISSKATIFASLKNMLNSKYPQIYKIGCAACEIQSLLKDIYDKVECVRKIIDDAKSIVNIRNEDAIIYSLVRQHTKSRELKHPCMTKFASTYTMLQSIFDNENELQRLVESDEWRKLDDNKKEIAEKITDIISNRNFWSQGREILRVLKPIVQVLCLVEGDGFTSGYLYEAMESAEAALKQHCDCNLLDYAPILELFEERRNRVHPMIAAAAFLNPAYMYGENFKEDEKMNEGIGFMLQNLVADEEKITFIKEVERYRMKASDLFTKAAMELLKTAHPRVWWNYCGHSLPVLRKYGIRILSQPCNSSCEQRWSAFEVAQTMKVKRQIVKPPENFVYVRMNTMIMENFNTLEERWLEPIDLKKCNELPDYVHLVQGREDDLAELIYENFDNKMMNEANPLPSDPQALTRQARREDLRKSMEIPEERCSEPIDLEKINELHELRNSGDRKQKWVVTLPNRNFDNNGMDKANPSCSYRQMLAENLRRQTYENMSDWVQIDERAVVGLSRPLSLQAEPFTAPNLGLQHHDFPIINQDQLETQLGCCPSASTSYREVGFLSSLPSYAVHRIRKPKAGWCKIRAVFKWISVRRIVAARARPFFVNTKLIRKPKAGWCKIRAVFKWISVRRIVATRARPFFVNTKLKRKLSDMLGPQWSKQELERFYEEGSDSEQESNEGMGASRKPQKGARAKFQNHPSNGSDDSFPDLLQFQSAASNYGCLSFLKKRRSDQLVTQLGCCPSAVIPYREVGFFYSLPSYAVYGIRNPKAGWCKIRAVFKWMSVRRIVAARARPFFVNTKLEQASKEKTVESVESMESRGYRILREKTVESREKTVESMESIGYTILRRSRVHPMHEEDEASLLGTTSKAESSCSWGALSSIVSLTLSEC